MPESTRRRGVREGAASQLIFQVFCRFCVCFWFFEIVGYVTHLAAATLQAGPQAATG